jgi:hypothetical protein
VALGVVVALTATVGCDWGAEASRALLAERRDSWTRELAGLKAQHAALAGRVDGRVASGAPAERRTRAVLDGARQSIADVEGQLRQAETRAEEGIRRGGAAGEKSIEAESAQARRYLQALAQQLGAAARQVDRLAWGEGESRQQTP